MEANRALQENVNASSDAVLVKQFYEEFMKLIRDCQQQGAELSMFDAL